MQRAAAQSVIITLAVSLHSAASLRPAAVSSAPPRCLSRRAALLALPLAVPAAASANMQQQLLDISGIAPQIPGLGQSAAPPKEPTESELLLAQRVRELVAKQEAAVGFKLEQSDVDECEEIVRNKYCGKQGLGFTLSDGSHGVC